MPARRGSCVFWGAGQPPYSRAVACAAVRVLRACKPKASPHGGTRHKALPPPRAAGRELPRGLSRALKTPRRGVFAGRDARRPARAVLVPDGAPSVRNVPGRRNKKQPCVPARLFLFGAPSGTRTQDPLIKSQLLSQTTRTKAINCTFNLTITQGSYGSQQVSMVAGNTQPSTVGKDQVSIVHDLSTPAWSSKSRFVLRA